MIIENVFSKAKKIKLNMDNYWVEFADRIPWEFIKNMYSDDIKNKENKDFPVRLIIGALIIQDKEDLSYINTIEKIKQSAELQYFVGISSSLEMQKFDADVLDFYRKNIDKNILIGIYNIITEKCVNEDKYIINENDSFKISTMYLIVICCLLGHSLFILVFSIMNERLLIYANLGSVCIYTFCIFLTQKRKIRQVTVFACVELFLHAIICTLVLGWNSGFQYYILGIVPIIVLNQNFKLVWKNLIAVITFSIYLFIYEIVYRFQLIWATQNFYILGDMNILMIFIFITFIIYKYNKEITQNNEHLKIINSKFKINSECDQLTGLFNRRYMMNIISYYKNQYDEEKNSFVIAIADIDKFKTVNDKFGHQCGDLVLIEESYNMRKSLQENEVMARWGGEEFIFIFPNADKQNGYEKMENIRKIVNETLIKYGEVSLKVSITSGLEVYDGSMSVENVLKNADSYLYYGKENGRNQVVSN